MQQNVNIVHTDCKSLLTSHPTASVQLIITDPPWNTGGKRATSTAAYHDDFLLHDYQQMITELLVESHRVLSPTGTLAIWTDYRWNPYVSVWGDAVFGRDNRVGEVICHAQLGNPGKKRWPVKHSNVVIFARDKEKQQFDVSALPLVDRTSSGPPERTMNGRLYSYSSKRRCNSVLATTLSSSDSQRTGYPDQKPAKVYGIFVKAYTQPGDTVIDPFAGSGTLGAGSPQDRNVILGDASHDAVQVMQARF